MMYDTSEPLISKPKSTVPLFKAIIAICGFCAILGTICTRADEQSVGGKGPATAAQLKLPQSCISVCVDRAAASCLACLRQNDGSSQLQITSPPASPITPHSAIPTDLALRFPNPPQNSPSYATRSGSGMPSPGGPSAQDSTNPSPLKQRARGLPPLDPENYSNRPLVVPPAPGNTPVLTRSSSDDMVQISVPHRRSPPGPLPEWSNRMGDRPSFPPPPSAGAGPSGTRPEPLVPVNSPMGPARVDPGMQPYFDSAPLSPPLSPDGRLRCSDPINGFEKKVRLCKNVKDHMVVRAATALQRPANPLEPLGPVAPLVLDGTASCASSPCSAKDKHTCCKHPRPCRFFLQDVPNGCSDGKVANPYEFAYCNTIPCRMQDSMACCVSPTGELYERLQKTDKFGSIYGKSKPARQDPQDKAKYVMPQISFSPKDIAWFDMSQKRTVNDEEWVPLVNFMQYWGDGMGWTQTAWMKFSSKGVEKYKPYQFGQVLTKEEQNREFWSEIEPV